MQATVEDQTIGRPATANGSGGDDTTEWLPCPKGSFRFVVGKPTVRQSRFVDKDNNPKWEVVFPLQLSDSEYERAKRRTSPQPGQQVSGRTRYTVGLSLGWFPEGRYKSTRLVDFLCASLGTENADRLRKHIAAGGGPARYTVEGWNDWLGYFEQAEVWGSVGHREDKQTAGKFWADFSGPTAVGDMPNETDDGYQAWGRARLKLLIAAGDAEPAQEAPTEKAADPNVGNAVLQPGSPEFEAHYNALFPEAK